MSASGSGLTASAAQLQYAFDRTFAEPPHADPRPSEDLLAITVGTDPYAVRLSEIAGLYADRKCTGLPGSVPGLLGLVALRGALLPMYDLRALLGYPGGAAPRWCVAAAGAPVVFAFERFEGHLRVPREAITVAGAGRADPLRSAHEVVSDGHTLRSLIHMSAVVEAIDVLARRATRPRE